MRTGIRRTESPWSLRGSKSKIKADAAPAGRARGSAALPPRKFGEG